METTKSPMASVVETFAAASPSEWGDLIDQRIRTLEVYKEQTARLVLNDDLTTLDGGAIMAGVAGQLFGYQAFHGQPTIADVLADVLRTDGSRR